jgi:hypothetical protein
MRVPEWFPFIFGIAVICLGVYLVFWAFRLRDEMRRSLRWPSTPGEVLKSKVITLGGRHPKTYSVRLSYQYQIGERVYEGSRPHLYDITTQKEAESIVERFPIGSEPQVFYDHRRPQRAVLVTGERPQKKGHELWMAAIVIAVGTGLASGHYGNFMKALESVGL